MLKSDRAFRVRFDPNAASRRIIHRPDGEFPVDHQYLQSIRILEAKTLLQAGLCVTEACFTAGFTDCSHFIAYFKRSVGVTPSAYAKRVK